MITLLLLLFGAQAYGPGLVRIDTVSVVMPMSEFRAAVVQIVDDSAASAQVLVLDSARQVDSAMIFSLRAALTDAQAGAKVQKQATELADATRVTNVISCDSIKTAAEKSSFWHGFKWGSGIFGGASIITLLFGTYLGTQLTK